MEKLEKQNMGHDFRIIPEMTICDGVSRVDIAVANGCLCGYEIKSDKDTLDRLAGQIDSYEKTFDKAYIVVGEKYRDSISRHIPDWWGIYVASYNERGEIGLREVRKGKRNRAIASEALLELLWSDEVKQLLNLYGFKSLSGKNRRVLRSMAVDSIPKEKIRVYTRETIKHRKEWR